MSKSWYRSAAMFGSDPFGAGELTDKVKTSPFGVAGDDMHSGLLEPSDSENHMNRYFSEDPKQMTLEKRMDELRKKKKKRKIIIKKSQALPEYSDDQLDPDASQNKDGLEQIKTYSPVNLTDKYDDLDLQFIGSELMKIYRTSQQNSGEELQVYDAAQNGYVKKSVKHSGGNVFQIIIGYASNASFILKAQVLYDLKALMQNPLVSENNRDQAFMFYEKIVSNLMGIENFWGLDLSNKGSYKIVPVTEANENVEIKNEKNLTWDFYLNRQKNKERSISQNHGFSYIGNTSNTGKLTQGKAGLNWYKSAQSNDSQIINKVLSATAMIYSSDGDKKEIGSGFFIGNNILLTCAHVASPMGGNSDVSIKYKGQDYRAYVWNLDHSIDTAVLIIEDPTFSTNDYLPLAISSEIPIGEEIVTIGNPLGFEQIAAKGIVSSGSMSLNESQQQKPYMFIDTDIRPGNSGGPIARLIDGSVIGLAAAVISEQQPAASTGLNAAIPVDSIKDFLSANNVNYRLIK